MKCIFIFLINYIYIYIYFFFLSFFKIKNNTPQQTVKVEEKHQRKKQKVVDPLAPKKPANAFFRFCQLQRKNMNSQINQIKSEDSSNSDITKILSNQWKQLPKEEKQVKYDINY